MNIYKFNRILLIFFFLNNIQANFSSEDELSLISTGGNTDSKTFFLKSKNLVKWSVHEITLKGSYTYGESEKVRNLEKWDINLRYDLNVSKKNSLFLGETIEANRFSGFSRRYNSDMGTKHSFIESDTTKLFAEIGYRYTIENKSDNERTKVKESKGRAYLEGNKTLNSTVSSKLWIEWIPNFSNSDKYLMNIEPSISVTLNKVFSFKMAYLWNYDNQPEKDHTKQDYKYTTSLIANF
ncbi:hypothetical protein A9Q84_07950 [Halobacteriovorax marinus]|uniref:DUF481 domain-containing protein n=1 Tax=Halobacteriovorax marinus TaxID=97084 RepID=A0A1Y5F9U6_9BACT|nr:hypothetical protein A9Q84_07950 [Halobacteriovorax marinus]